MYLPRSKHILILRLQSPFIVILEPKKINSVTASTFPHLFAMKWWDWMPWSEFFECWVLSQFFHSPLLPSSRGSLVLLCLLPIRVVSAAYLRLLIFLLAILIPACDSSSLAFHMIYSAYKLNMQGDSVQPWCTPFPILNQSVVPCPVLTIASWPAYRFCKRLVCVWVCVCVCLMLFFC